MLKINTRTKLDPSQPVFMGIDVHKKKYSISFVHCDQFIRRVTIEATELALQKLVKNYQGFVIRSIYEAGFSGFHLHYFLQELGVENIVISPNKLEVKPNKALFVAKTKIKAGGKSMLTLILAPYPPNFAASGPARSIKINLDLPAFFIPVNFFKCIFK